MDEEIIENPVTGESIKVLESTAETFKFQYSLRPHACIAGAHFHPNKVQSFSVLSGELCLQANGVHQIVRAGESVKLPVGAHHFQWNASDNEVIAIEEIHPAGCMHDFFRVLFGLAKDGKTNAKGYPSPLVAAALVSEFRDSILPAPIGLRLLFSALAPIASIFGYRRVFTKYMRIT